MSSNHSSDCSLHNPQFRSCCCNCRWHVRDFHHCTTPEGSRLRAESGNGCVCSVPRGWICAGFLLSGEGPQAGAHSGWGEHGLCEMHQPKGSDK
jgi:hypothetical protein